MFSRPVSQSRANAEGDDLRLEVRVLDLGGERDGVESVEVTEVGDIGLSEVESECGESSVLPGECCRKVGVLWENACICAIWSLSTSLTVDIVVQSNASDDFVRSTH